MSWCGYFWIENWVKFVVLATSVFTMVRKRLFLGGLYHEVDAASLTDRFAAYGQISNVDIKTKCDSEGVPFKVQQYANHAITDNARNVNCIFGASVKEFDMWKIYGVLWDSLFDTHWDCMTHIDFVYEFLLRRRSLTLTSKSLPRMTSRNACPFIVDPNGKGSRFPSKKPGRASCNACKRSAKRWSKEFMIIDTWKHVFFISELVLLTCR